MDVLWVHFDRVMLCGEYCMSFGPPIAMTAKFQEMSTAQGGAAACRREVRADRHGGHTKGRRDACWLARGRRVFWTIVDLVTRFQEMSTAQGGAAACRREVRADRHGGHTKDRSLVCPVLKFGVCIHSARALSTRRSSASPLCEGVGR
jgi:hypothetical protein